jgi:hypothetical protein
MDADLLELVVDFPEVLKQALVEVGPLGQVLAGLGTGGFLRLHELVLERTHEVVICETGLRSRGPGFGNINDHGGLTSRSTSHKNCPRAAY